MAMEVTHSRPLRAQPRRPAADDLTRDAAVTDIMSEIGRIATRRGVEIERKDVQRTAAVACSPRLQSLLAEAVGGAGPTPRRLASGADHDAMMFDRPTDIAMLFVRCGNGGVSRSPGEIITMLDAVLELATTS